jgi:hypothetical protein
MPYGQLSGTSRGIAGLYRGVGQSLFPDASKFFALLAIDFASQTVEIDGRQALSTLFFLPFNTVLLISGPLSPTRIEWLIRRT